MGGEGNRGMEGESKRTDLHLFLYTKVTFYMFFSEQISFPKSKGNANLSVHPSIWNPFNKENCIFFLMGFYMVKNGGK